MNQYQKRAYERINKIARLHASFDINDEQASITDILTDLRHWCDKRKVNFAQAMNMSYDHYLAEKTTEPQE